MPRKLNDDRLMPSPDRIPDYTEAILEIMEHELNPPKVFQDEYDPDEWERDNECFGPFEGGRDE